MEKQVKIIGLSVNKQFGGLKATQLKFDDNNRLTVVKGEVGSGKTTLNRALSLTTKGSKTLDDNNLYGDVDLTAQLLDGNHKVFVECKSNKDGKLVHTIYTTDVDGNKLRDVVIDGKKLTPANYLNSLQTSLTWRLDELTSENPVTQRKLLLELYQSELEKEGVIFDKHHPDFTDSIIHKIEKAKSERNYADMKRKEVGGIGEDLRSKGIDLESRKIIKDTEAISSDLSKLKSERDYIILNNENYYKNKLNEIKTAGIEINSKLKDVRDSIKDANEQKQTLLDNYQAQKDFKDNELNNIKNKLISLEIDSIYHPEILNLISSRIEPLYKPEIEFEKQLEFNEKGQCISNPDDYEDDTINKLLIEYNDIQESYIEFYNQSKQIEPDTSEIDKKIKAKSDELENAHEWNKEAQAVNKFHDWKDANEEVKSLQSDYYKKLTDIDTGVEGLHIALENEQSEDIFLMYDGSYDVDYFRNPNKELRKLSSYSDTQKPLICLLIQNYLLKKKGKSLPYLWIDKVPIDKKTKQLLDKMSEDLGLWLFVSWTGDFDKTNLVDGELLIENGEVFFNELKSE